MSILLLTIILVTLSKDVAAQDCSASVTLVERPGSWVEGGQTRRIYDAHLTNTGSCTLSGDIPATITFSGGSSLGYHWGYNPSTNTFPNIPSLAPGQSYSGIGFIANGDNVPTATAGTITTCSCSSQPTSTPTSAPTSTPTPTANIPPANAADLGMTFLLLSCQGNESTFAAAQLSLNAIGAPYDQVVALTAGTAQLSLTNTDGSGKYYAIVSAGDIACWTADQQAQINNYASKFKVKMVILYTYPSTLHGMNATLPGNNYVGNLTFAPAFANYLTAVNPNAVVSVSSWIYPSSVFNPDLAVPAINIAVNGGNYVAAAFVTLTTSYGPLKMLEFYYDQATWALFAAAIAPAWVNWVSNGIYVGARRMVLSCHTDDVFMKTGRYDPTTFLEGSTTYRLTPADVARMVDWQHSLVARMPAGSSFKTTFPFNGETIMEFGGYSVDPLYLALKPVRDEFFWESHTWDHVEFDNPSLNYDQVYQEFLLNNATALQLFDNDLTNPNFNTISVITPAITGLFNGDALRAMWDIGIRNLCSDNSHPEQDPTNWYHGWYTNATNNFTGMFIVPRMATNIYYDAAQIEDITLQYNHDYSTTLTFDDIMALEVTTNTRTLLQFRHDPYMFHQANMATITYEGQTTSLYTWWVDRIVDSVMSYSTLPIISYKHQDQAQQLKDREARDACGVSTTLRVDPATNKIGGFVATSTGTCKYAFSGASSVLTSGGVSNEVVGPEQTIWIDMVPGQEYAVQFTTPIALYA